jgi:hypothetical protein
MDVDNSLETVSPSLSGRYFEDSSYRIASLELLGRMVESETGLRLMALSFADARLDLTPNPESSSKKGLLSSAACISLQHKWLCKEILEEESLSEADLGSAKPSC